MKTLALIFLIIISFRSIQGQEYFPFDTEFAYWDIGRFHVFDGYSSWEECYEEYDTIQINGLRYQQLWRDFFSYLGAYREDSNKKVYFYPYNEFASAAHFPEANMEYLLYDFSKDEIGDTVFYPHCSYIVTMIDSILINNSCRPIFFYELLDNSNEDVMLEFWAIEGIGGRAGLLTPYMYEFEWVYWLEYYEDYLSYYSNDGGTVYDQLCSIINVDDNDWINAIEVYPNPCGNYLNIDASKLLGKCTIKLVDSFGKMMDQHDSVTGIISIDVSQFEAAVYCLEIISEKGKQQRIWIKS